MPALGSGSAVPQLSPYKGMGIPASNLFCLLLRKDEPAWQALKLGRLGLDLAASDLQSCSKMAIVEAAGTAGAAAAVSDAGPELVQQDSHGKLAALGEGALRAHAPELRYFQSSQAYLQCKVHPTTGLDLRCCLEDLPLGRSREVSKARPVDWPRCYIEVMVAGSNTSGTHSTPFDNTSTSASVPRSERLTIAQVSASLKKHLLRLWDQGARHPHPKDDFKTVTRCGCLFSQIPGSAFRAGWKTLSNQEAAVHDDCNY